MVQEERTATRWKWIHRTLLLALTLLFLFIAGSREIGRVYYQQALSALSPAHRTVALMSARYWDRGNPVYPFQLARIYLVQGGTDEISIQRGLEMADALTRRGLSVTMLVRSGKVLKTIDPRLQEIVRAELNRNGVKLIDQIDVTAIEEQEGSLVLAIGGYFKQ